MNEAGTQGAFTATTGATILAVDSTAGTPLPVVLTYDPGLGRVILFADVDIIANAASAGGTITNGNNRFLGSLFVSVTPFAPAPAPTVLVPTLSQYGLLLPILLVATFAWRLRKRGF